MIRSLTIIFATCLFITGWSQTDFRFRNYSIKEGLSQSSVTCIVQDELNSLWVGTQDGLNRFDGRSFEIFVADDTDGLESSYIRCAELADNSKIWFGTNNGLTSFDLSKEEFKTFTYEKNAALRITDIHLRSDQKILVATEESGLFLFDTRKKEFANWKDKVPSRKINKLYQVAKNELLVFTGDKGLFLLNTKTGTSTTIKLEQTGLQSLVVNNIVDNGSGKLYLCTNQGVYSLDNQTKQSKKELIVLQDKYGIQNVSDLYHHQELGWIITTKGNGLFNLDQDNKVHHYTADIFQKDALLFDELNEIYRDNSGVIWITSQRGLSSFDPNNRGILGVGPSGNATKGIPTPSVWSFAESEDEKYILIGTDYSVTRLDKESGEFRQYHRKREGESQSKGEMAVLSINIIDHSKILVGCADGLFQLEITSGDYRFKRIDLGRGEGYPNHERVYSIVQWSEDSYLLGTKDGVILYNVVNGRKQYFEHDQKNTSETISRGACRLIYKDRHDRIWATTSAGGLNILANRNGVISFRPYEYNSLIRGASKDYITSIYHDVEGNYWLGTFGSGLVRWNEKTKATDRINKEDGLPNDVIYGVISDTDGNLWMSTNKGLCSYQVASGKIQAYTEEDGLMSNEFNLGAYMRAQQGKLFFGGIYGYNYFNPKELSHKKKDINVVFTRFKLENEWLKPNREGSPLKNPIFRTKEINLSYKQRSFTIRFQPSDLSNPEQINYKYILEGSEEGEILIGEMNEIHFNALASGSYVLKVYARIGEGEWSRKPAVMNIDIAPPFWMTWWFGGIMLLVLVVVIRIFIKRRIEASRREQIKLEMKVRTRTKEIQLKNEKIEAQKQKIEEEKNKVIQQQKLLQKEKDKTEKLLKNVIPESTAEELKKRGRARARAYKSVSVLFTDFVGFTKISDRMTATELVKKLDVYFTKFDEIIVKNNLEKIKTIGDAYMCAGGVPVRNRTNAIDTCLAALQIQAYMLKRKNDAIANNQEYWELRLGINTGEVTAGVIGSERLAYDIWGATVNQAQRMEMLGEPGKVTVTGATHTLIEPYFDTTFKGKAQSKSRGLIDMYVVERIKPELSIKGEGIVPNKKFHEIVNLHHYSSINYYKAERHIMKLLEQHLSKDLHYHSIAHTKDVVKAVERLALSEGVTDEGLFLLKSAATYHDAGFIEQYDENEPIGVRLAQEILPKYGYTQEHIDRIKELIYVTKIPHAPSNKLEEIICDADLDYLGRDDFHEIADKLRHELRDHGKINSDRQWDEIQIKFLTSHRYFTKTAKKTRLKKKLANLEEIKERLKEDNYKD